MKTKPLHLQWALVPLVVVLLLAMKPVDNRHFLIHGNIIELSPQDMRERDAANVQIIVYQDDEIYVAFDTDEKGDYKFNLPNGHMYEVQYGTRDFVPKKIHIDATGVETKKDGFSIKMNVALFKAVEHVDYAIMEDPVSTFNFIDTKKGFELDYNFAMRRMEDVEDLYKVMAKQAKKNDKALSKID